MRKLDQVLVVEGSAVARELMARLMRPYAKTIHAIADCEEARQWIAGNAELSLVIADLDAPGGGGLRLLEFTAGIGSRRPRLLLTGLHISEQEHSQAELLGAIGCVAKPIYFHEITRAIRASEEPGFSLAPPRVHAEPPARAHLLDPYGRESHIVWSLHDLSISGALLDTRGPIPLRTELALAISFENERVPVQCEVVRVQEPDWYSLPGVAVRFRELAPEDRSRLEAYIRRKSPRP